MAAARTGLFDRNPEKHREARQQSLPKPDGHALGRRVLQSLHFVEEVMIEPRHDRIDDALQVGEVDEPARMRIDVSAHGELSAKRMAVHPPALVTFGHVRKVVGGLEAEVLDQLDGMI